MSNFAPDSIFNTMSRPSVDPANISQTDLQSTNFTDHMLDSFFTNVPRDQYLLFATTQPSVMASGMVHGAGVQSSLVDVESTLVISRTGDRSLEKLQLNQRPFLTIPYLGKGSCDPVFESRLRQGENINEHRSVSSMSEKSVFGYILPPNPETCSEANTVEDAAFNGWGRGGMSTREMPVSN